MWKDNLNIEVTLTNQEWKVYLDSITNMHFQIARRGWIGDYVDPNNFLDLFISTGGNNNTGFADPAYDEMILREAPQAATREERFAIFKKAETLLMEQMPIIPIYTYTSKHLIHPSVNGMPPNLMDSVNMKYVWLDKDWQPIEAGHRYVAIYQLAFTTGDTGYPGRYYSDFLPGANGTRRAFRQRKSRYARS